MRRVLLIVMVLMTACSAEPATREVGTTTATFTAPIGTPDADMERTVEVLDERLAAMDVDGAVRRVGHEVTVEIPDDREEVFAILPRSADLQFQPIVERLPDGSQGDDVLRGREELDYRLGPSGADASDVASAEASQTAAGQWTISLVLTEPGLARFNELAARCFDIDVTCRSGQVAVVVDNRVVSAPSVQARNYENEQIIVSSDFTEQQARELAALLRTGGLPVPLVRTDR